MAAGQCYLIVSRMHGHVLDVERGSPSPGTRVMPWIKNGKENQQWYDDPATGTIRSMIGGLCLDIEGDQKLRIMPYQAGDPNQQWERDPQGYIRNRVHRNKVLDIMNRDQTAGATIGMWDQNNGPNQLWDFQFTGAMAPQMGGYGGYPQQQQQYPGQGYPAQGYPGQVPAQGYPGQAPAQGYPGVPPQCQYPQAGSQCVYPSSGASVQRRDFVIVSEMNGKVFDVRRGEAKAGADIITWSKNSPPGNNQRWYTDPQGYIRTALNDFAIDAGPGKKAEIQPFTGGPNQQWVIDGRNITNRATGEVLDIYGGKNHDGADIGSYKRNDSSKNQHWRIEYV